MNERINYESLLRKIEENKQSMISIMDLVTKTVDGLQALTEIVNKMLRENMDV